MKKSPKLYAALIIGALIRVWFIFSNHYISPDGTHYASLGHNFVHFGRYVSQGSQFPDIIQPPLYPFLIGIFSLFINSVIAGKLAALIFGLMQIVFFYWAVYKISNNKVLGEVSAVLLSLNPAFISISTQVATESVFYFFLFGVFAFLLLYFMEDKRNTKSYIVYSALFAGFAYLTRPEIIIYIFIIILLILFFRRKRMRDVLTYGWIIILFVIFYSGFILLNSGRIYFYPKIKFVQIHSKLSRYFKARDTQDIYTKNNKLFINKVRYSLNPAKNEIWANSIFWGIDRLPKYQNVSGFHSQRWKRFSTYLKSNFLKAFKKFIAGGILPFSYLLFLLIGIIKFKWRKHKKLVVYAISYLFPTLIILLTNVEQRFLYFPGLLAFPLIAYGVLSLQIPIFKSRQINYLRSHKTNILLIFIIIMTIPYYIKIYQKMTQNNYYYSASQWLKEQVPEGSIIAATVPQSVFFSDLKYVVLPFASLESSRKYLYKKQVDYILIESKDRFRRPWSVEQANWPKFIYQISSRQFDSQKMILFQVIK